VCSLPIYAACKPFTYTRILQWLLDSARLLEVAGGSRLGGCLAAADGDGCVDCDHFGEDVEDGLGALVMYHVSCIHGGCECECQRTLGTVLS
jgi:hypothetical protein